MVFMSLTLLIGLFTADSVRVVKKSKKVVEKSNWTPSKVPDGEVPRGGKWYRDLDGSGDGADCFRDLFNEMTSAKFPTIPGGKVELKGINSMGLAGGFISGLTGMANPFLGLGISLVFGLLGDAEQMIENDSTLIKSILAHVDQMIDNRFDEEKVKKNQIWLSHEMMNNVRWAQGDEWKHLPKEFVNADFFSPACVEDPYTPGCKRHQLTNGGKKLATELYYITTASTIWTELMRLGSNYTDLAHRMGETIAEAVAIVDVHWVRFKEWRMKDDHLSRLREGCGTLYREGDRFGNAEQRRLWKLVHWCYHPCIDSVTSKYMVDESCPGLSSRKSRRAHQAPNKFRDDTQFEGKVGTVLKFCAPENQASLLNSLATCRTEYMDRIKGDMDKIGNIVEGMKKFRKDRLLTEHKQITDWFRTVACAVPRHDTNPNCTLESTGQCNGKARYGKDDKWTSWQNVSGQFECTKGFFNNQDPYFGMAKECQCHP